MSQMNTFKPIALTFKWNKENFGKAFANAYAHQFKYSARRYVGWLFVAMAQFGVVAALKGGSPGLLMLSTLLLFYWYVAKKWLVHRRALEAFEASPLKNSNITLTITQEGVIQEDTLVGWEEIEGIVPVEEAILLYYQGKSFYIPASAFSSIEERSRLKSLAKEKGKLFDV